MEFKIDNEFKNYWPPLSKEKLLILEKSILKKGLLDNLIVWEEENILLDGYQRKKILEKHNIPYEKRINYLSFSSRLDAKREIHLTQQGRRGDVCKFLCICHVLEFEEIYRVEAKKRHGMRTDLRPTEGLKFGKAIEFMAQEAPAGKNSIAKIIYIKKYDEDRFNKLKKLAEMGIDVNIDSPYLKVKNLKENNQLDKKSIEKLSSRRSVEAFSRAVKKTKPSPKTQKKIAQEIAEQEIDEKGEIEERTQIFETELLKEEHGLSHKVKQKEGNLTKLIIQAKEKGKIFSKLIDELTKNKKEFDSEKCQGSLEYLQFGVFVEELAIKLNYLLGGIKNEKKSKPLYLGKAN